MFSKFGLKYALHIIVILRGPRKHWPLPRWAWRNAGSTDVDWKSMRETILDGSSGDTKMFPI